jgi:hypothetical protein
VTGGRAIYPSAGYGFALPSAPGRGGKPAAGAPRTYPCPAISCSGVELPRLLGLELPCSYSARPAHSTEARPGDQSRQGAGAGKRCRSRQGRMLCGTASRRSTCSSSVPRRAGRVRVRHPRVADRDGPVRHRRWNRRLDRRGTMDPAMPLAAASGSPAGPLSQAKAIKFSKSEEDPDWNAVTAMECQRNQGCAKYKSRPRYHMTLGPCRARQRSDSNGP